MVHGRSGKILGSRAAWTMRLKVTGGEGCLEKPEAGLDISAFG